MKNRGQLVLGIILIVLGAFFVSNQLFPNLRQWTEMYMEWPLNIVGIGLLLLLIGVLLGAPGMAVPAAIVAGVGGILYFQEQSGDYQTWSYMWTLIPGFAGIGTVLSGLISRDISQARSGLNMVVVSTVLFIIFAAFFGKLNVLGSYGPAILLVAVGVWLLFSSLLRGRHGNKGGSS